MPQTLERPPRAPRTPSNHPLDEEDASLLTTDDTADAALSAAPTPDEEYLTFGNVESRNGLQERIEIPLLLRALRLPQRGRVLEIGCGRGVALPVLAERLHPDELTGVDIDHELIAAARGRVARTNTRAELHVADVRALPFVSGSFDLVIDFGTCYHVGGGPTGRLTALNEIARVLCVGGLFVHETRVAQHLAHPVRSFGRRLPWSAVSMLAPDRSALLWMARRRIGPVLV
ncbi:MAG: class I SAM-dependent methyltransferase [Gemmatimonadaceae bacterium]